MRRLGPGTVSPHRESFEQMSLLFRRLILLSATLQRWGLCLRAGRMRETLDLVSSPRHASVVDLAFSDSAIEHLRTGSTRILYAEEAKRLAPSWWIHAPNPLCPIDARTGMPYLWQWPTWVKAAGEDIRRQRIPEWHDEMTCREPAYEEEMRAMFRGG
jgi:hypothetical protein